MFRRVSNALPVWAWAFLLLTAPMLVQVVEYWCSLPIVPGHLFSGSNVDPDSWLRLTLVRDWLEGGSWYDHHYASNAPLAPSISPWTRPVDMVIAALVKLQPGTADLSLKLLRVAVVLPWLWVVLLSAGLLRNLWHITQVPAAFLMLAVLMHTNPAAYNYFSIGNVDHHAPLAVCWVWAVYYLISSSEHGWRLPLGVGLLTALMLWVSPEALVLISAMLAWLSFCWLRGQFPMRTIARLASVLCIASASAVLIERPKQEWFLPLYDSISVVHVALLAACAIATWALTLYRRDAVIGRLIVGALAAAAVVAVMYHCYPLFFHGPMAQVDSYIHSDFLPRITEADSIFSQGSLAYALGMMLQPLIALQIAEWMAARYPGVIPKRSAATLACLLVVCIILYASQLRWYYYLYPLVALVLAPWLGAWFTPDDARLQQLWPASRVRQWNEHGQMLRRLPLLIALIAIPIGLQVIALEKKTPQARENGRCARDTRRIIESGELTRLLGPEVTTVYASTNIGAEILFFTPYRIIASNYHREGAAIRDVWDTEKTADLAQFRATLTKRQVDALILCPSADTRKDSIVTRLRSGELHAAWLTRLSATTPYISKKGPAIFLVNPAGPKHSRRKQ